MTSAAFDSASSPSLDSSSVAGSRKQVRKMFWLFEERNQSAPHHGFSRYLLVSALGIFGALFLLALAAVIPAYAVALRVSALAWFLIFGAVRITLFRLK